MASVLSRGIAPGSRPWANPSKSRGITTTIGHCIGVDPYYLTYQAEKFGHHPEVILAGRRINDGMGKYIAEQTVKNMVKTRGSLNGGVVDIIREWKEYGLSFHIHDLQADRPRSRASRIPRHAD